MIWTVTVGKMGYTSTMGSKIPLLYQVARKSAKRIPQEAGFVHVYQSLNTN